MRVQHPLEKLPLIQHRLIKLMDSFRQKDHSLELQLFSDNQSYQTNQSFISPWITVQQKKGSLLPKKQVSDIRFNKAFKLRKARLISTERYPTMPQQLLASKSQAYCQFVMPQTKKLPERQYKIKRIMQTAFGRLLKKRYSVNKAKNKQNSLIQSFYGKMKQPLLQVQLRGQAQSIQPTNSLNDRHRLMGRSKRVKDNWYLIRV